MTIRRHKPPKHLSNASQTWWARVANDYDLEPHHIHLLTLAAEALDRGVQAREAIAENGTIYEDRFGQPRARPEIGIERDSRIAFARLLRELALDIEEPEAARPPVSRGNSHLRLSGA